MEGLLPAPRETEAEAKRRRQESPALRRPPTLEEIRTLPAEDLIWKLWDFIFWVKKLWWAKIPDSPDLDHTMIVGVLEALKDRSDPSAFLFLSRIRRAIGRALSQDVRDFERQSRVLLFEDLFEDGTDDATAEKILTKGYEAPGGEFYCLNCGRDPRIMRKGYLVAGLCSSCARARLRAKVRFGGEGVCRVCAGILHSRRGQPSCKCEGEPCLTT